MKLAKVCNVRVDYSIGEGQPAAIDHDLLRPIEKLGDAIKQHSLLKLLSRIIKTKKAFNQ